MRRAQILGCVTAATLTLGAWLASAEPCLGVVIDVYLNSEFDQFGSQIETAQIYEDAFGTQWMAYGIYDTGASVITISSYDQQLFYWLSGSTISVKVAGGANADGIGGTLNGDVSQPGKIHALGVGAVDIFTGEVTDWSHAAFAPGGAGEYGVQVLLGTETGSPSLPTITGTPIHNGRLTSDPTAANGIAAKIDMQYGFDFGALLAELFPEYSSWEEIFGDMRFTVPNVEFVASGTQLQAIEDDLSTTGINESTTAPVRVPLALYGYDNHVDPGDTVTASYNPFQNTGVLISDGGTTLGGDPSDRLAMLFDTGASLSIISNAMAASLGLNLSAPEFSVEVEGAAGGIGSIPGFTVDSLILPIDDDGQIIFHNVPVFVFDVTPADTDPAEGLDGILGMNLFNTAGGMLYDPFDPLGPSLSLTFLTDPYSETIDDDLLSQYEMAIAMLASSGFPFSTTALALPGVRQEIAVVPEPSTLLLLVSGGLVLAVGWRRRRRPG